MSEEGRPEVDRLRSRAAGADPVDPYEDVDVSELPGWWRRAIREFEAHGLRPYRPPRFEDGTPTRDVIERIERDLGVEIVLGSVSADYAERWEIRVDGSVVGTVGRHRSPEGYTVYETTGARFEDEVRSAVAPDDG
jgi:hypothetical protein